MILKRVRIHGHEIAFRKEGRGPVLLFLHGMVGSCVTWDGVIPALARDFTVVAPDLLGHGKSAKPRTDYSLGAHASVMRDLMVALGHERATLIGQSFGGGVAMQIAYQFPELCERLVLVGSGGLGIEVNPILRALSVPGAAYLLPLGCRAVIRDVGDKVGAWLERRGRPASAANREIWRAYSALTDADTRRAFVHTLRAVVDHMGQRVTAHDRLYLTSEVSTLILWGDHDPVIPVHHAYEAHRAMPGSRLEIFPNAGHFPHCEDPARFIRVVTEFIGKTPAATIRASDWRGLLNNAKSA